MLELRTLGAPGIHDARGGLLTASPSWWRCWCVVARRYYQQALRRYDLPVAALRRAVTEAEAASPHTFHTIFVQPWAYRHVQETGEFTDNTISILAMSNASRVADPARGGPYEGTGMVAEIHLKRQDLSASGWGFYAFGGGTARR